MENDFLIKNLLENEKITEILFLELQFEFANKVSSTLNIDIKQSLLKYTSFYKKFGLPWPIDEKNIIWQEFLASLKGEDFLNKKDFCIKVFNFSASLKEKESKEVKDKPKLDYIHYEYNPMEKDIRLHFDPKNKQPINSPGFLLKIKENIKNILEEVKLLHPDAKTISGASWLFNFNFKSIFPLEFVNSSKEEEDRFSSLSIWGQFVSSSSFRENTANIFRDNFKKAKSLEDFQKSFPSQVISRKCKIDSFYAFYDLA